MRLNSKGGQASGAVNASGRSWTALAAVFSFNELSDLVNMQPVKDGCLLMDATQRQEDCCMSQMWSADSGKTVVKVIRSGTKQLYRPLV